MYLKNALKINAYCLSIIWFRLGVVENISIAFSASGTQQEIYNSYF